MLFTEWTHQTYVVYGMDPSNLCCLQYGPIKLMLLTVWTRQTYVVYGMDPSNLCCLQYGHIKLMLFTNGPIKLKLLTVWRYRTHAVYSMDIFLYDKHSKLTLLTVLAHPSFSTTRYTETRHNITGVIVTVVRTIMFTVLSIRPINTSYNQIIYKTSNKNFVDGGKYKRICHHCSVVSNITLDTPS